MEMEQITIKVPRDMALVTREIAAEQDVSVGQVIRKLLDREIGRRRGAKTPNRADERLVARLQRLLAPTMADARNWQDLHGRLLAQGLKLQVAGGGLTLHDAATGERLCKSSELGFAYSRLVRRFQSPMPGHPHRMEHIWNAPAVSDGGEDDDFDLIEPF